MAIDPLRLEAQRRALSDTPEPLKIRGGRGKLRIDMQTGIVCVKCRAKCISERNYTGLCRDCWHGTGRVARLSFQAAFRNQPSFRERHLKRTEGRDA
jgi:hypothetical protein